MFPPRALVYLSNRLRKNSVDAENMVGISRTALKPVTSGCSKRPRFSPSQPRRAKTRRSAGKAAVSEEARRYGPHFVGPFALAICLGERKSPSSASDFRKTLVEPLSDARTPLADFFSILLSGWPGLALNCARRARPFLGRALRENRYLCPLQACSLLLKGSTAWSILYCARRTSTFLSCAFREQEDDQAVLPHPYFHPSPFVPPPNPPKFPPKPPCPAPQYSPF